MNDLVNTILRRVLEGQRGGSLMSRVATAGMLRLALRWPVLTVVLILSVIAARVLTARRHPDHFSPALRAR